MGTLATVEYARESRPWEKLIYDIKRGGKSLLASVGYFSAALLEPAGISTVEEAVGLVDVPDEIEVIGPFALFQGTTACIEVDGTMASADKPTEYACWTQVGGRLKKLVVHPRLKDVNLSIRAEIYECEGWGGDGSKVREKKGSRRKCELSTDGQLSFLGAAIEPAERVSICVMPATPTLVRATDFIVLMREVQ